MAFRKPRPIITCSQCGKEARVAYLALNLCQSCNLKRWRINNPEKYRQRMKAQNDLRQKEYDETDAAECLTEAFNADLDDIINYVRWLRDVRRGRWYFDSIPEQDRGEHGQAEIQRDELIKQGA